MFKPNEMTLRELESKIAQRRRRTALLIADVVVTMVGASVVGYFFGLAAAVATVAVSTTIFHVIGWRVADTNGPI